MALKKASMGPLPSPATSKTVSESPREANVRLALGVHRLLEGVFEELIGGGGVDIILLEQLQNTLGLQLSAYPLSLRLDDVSKFGMHGLG